MTRLGVVTCRGVAVVLAVGALGGCHSTKSRDSSRRSAPTAAATPRLTAVLDDGGLKLSSRHIRAGRYLVTFRDSRSRRPVGDKVVLRFSPSGPNIVLLEVAAGAQRVAALYQNEVPWVAINGVEASVAGSRQLEVDPTPEFSTPVT
jgi:hypothetical protein